MKKNIWSLAMMLFFPITLAALSGCGATKLHVVEDAPFVLTKGEKLDLAVRPHESLGIKITPAILSGRVTVFKKFTISNKIYYSEEYPGRIRWNGWLVTPDGREYFAQIIRTGRSSKGKYEYKAIVDGLPFELKGGRIVGLSSMLHFATDFDGRAFDIDGRELTKQRAYRYALTMKLGSKVDDLIIDGSNFIQNVRKLNRYGLKDEGGEIFCEYSEEYFRKIAIINPGYGIMEKFVLHGRGQINIPLVPDPMMFGAGVALSLGMNMIDFMVAIHGKSEGWDFGSGSQDNKTRAFVMLWIENGNEKFEAQQAKKITELERHVLELELAATQVKAKGIDVKPAAYVADERGREKAYKKGALR